MGSQVHGGLMHPTHPPVMPDEAFPFLTDLSRRVEGHRFAPLEVIDAVAALTAAVAPDRADGLRPRACEPPALVQRLAVWALRQADSDAVRKAHAVLRGETVEPLSEGYRTTADVQTGYSSLLA